MSIDASGQPLEGDVTEGAALSILGPIPMPSTFGEDRPPLHWYPFVRHTELASVQKAAIDASHSNESAFREIIQKSMSVNSILATPNFHKSESPLVRVHSCCLTGDVFGSMRCECGPQLHAALEKIQEEGGAIVYMNGHEGRGIGLWAKAVTYLLQDDGQDTYQANKSLGLPEDCRDFSDAAFVLKYFLQGRGIRLLSNNPFKREQLEAHGQTVTEIVPFLVGKSSHNERYLHSKRSKGHLLPP